MNLSSLSPPDTLSPPTHDNYPLLTAINASNIDDDEYKAMTISSSADQSIDHYVNHNQNSNPLQLMHNGLLSSDSLDQQLNYIHKLLQ